MRRLVAGLAVVALAGCGAAEPASRGTSPAAGSARQAVGLTEWDVVTERRPLLPGDVELRVTNAGAAPHDLVVDLDGERLAATPVLATGEQATLHLTVPPGAELTLWCTVPGHHEAGMYTDVVVASGEGGEGAA